MGKDAPLTPAESLELRRLLARAGDYAFSPQREYWASLGKPRLLCEATPEDEMVIQALADALRERAAASLSPDVFSYVPGRGPFPALRALRRHLARTLRQAPDDPVYVLRADVREYTDRVPLGERSRLWELLRDALPDPALFALARRALRPELKPGAQAGARSRFQGAPTGSRLTPWIANLYLRDLDAALGSRAAGAGALYLRYGDDLIFACADRRTAEAAWGELNQGLGRLGLELNAEKSFRLRLSRNGACPSDEKAAGWRGASGVSYLGFRVSRSGTLGLTAEKRSLLLREARLRIRCVLESEGWAPPAPLSDATGRRIAAALNDLWEKDWRGSLYRDRLQRLTDPGELRALRIDLAREILRALRGSTHGRGFRALPWRLLLRGWGWRPPGLKVRDA